MRPIHSNCKCNWDYSARMPIEPMSSRHCSNTTTSRSSRLHYSHSCINRIDRCCPPIPHHRGHHNRQHRHDHLLDKIRKNKLLVAIILFVPSSIWFDVANCNASATSPFSNINFFFATLLVTNDVVVLAIPKPHTGTCCVADF